MKPTAFSIGRLAAETGAKVQTIRYYEQIGLLPPPDRTSGNQRRYDETHRRRLAFIRHARDFGFSLEQIRALLALSDEPARPCHEVDRIARTHLVEVERRLSRLGALKRELERMLEQCAGERVADCRIVEVLSDHAQCLATRH